MSPSWLNFFLSPLHSNIVLGFSLDVLIGDRALLGSEIQLQLGDAQLFRMPIPVTTQSHTRGNSSYLALWK